MLAAQVHALPEHERATDLQAGSLYILVSAPSPETMKYRQGQGIPSSHTPAQILHNLEQNIENAFHYDLYVHNPGQTDDLSLSSSLHRYNQEYQDWEPQKGADTLRDVKDVANLEFLVCMVRVMDFSIGMMKPLDDIVGKARLPRTVRTSVDWCFQMLELVEREVRSYCFVPGRDEEDAGKSIDFDKFRHEITTFAKLNLEGALQAKKPRPLLNLFTRAWVLPEMEMVTLSRTPSIELI